VHEIGAHGVLHTACLTKRLGAAYKEHTTENTYMISVRMVYFTPLLTVSAGDLVPHTRKHTGRT
jgi:hypothetical protein